MSMTSKERVIAALEHREPDLVPWGEHSIDYNIYEMVLGRPSLCHGKFKEDKAMWEGHRAEVVKSHQQDTVDLIRALGMDLATVSLMPPAHEKRPVLTQVDHETWKDESNGDIYKVGSITGDLMKVPLNTAFIAREIEYEEMASMAEKAKEEYQQYGGGFHPEERFEIVDHVVKELGDTHFLIVPINGIEWPRFGETEEDSWVNLLLEPEICEKMAEMQYWNTMKTIDSLKDRGVDGVLSVGDLGNTTNLAASPALYHQIIEPWHKKIYEACKERGLYVLRHCCGHIWPVINEIAAYNDAYESIQEFAGMDLARLKKEVGSEVCLWGGVLHEHIHGGTPEEVREDVRRSMEIAAPGGGFIMGSSHSLTIGATLDNVMAMKQARLDYGWR